MAEGWGKHTPERCKFYAALGAEIKRVRLAKRLTRKEVCGRVGVVGPTLWGYETGRGGFMSLEMLCRLGDALECNPCDWLRAAAGELGEA